MNKMFFLLAGLVLLLGSTATAENISVEVVSDQGYSFPKYPINASPGNYRAYVQAKHNARYGLRIRNHTDSRIGLVIAVDGRNIISGEKSSLRNTERMYVLEPYGVASYRGWRTDQDEVHRFYFTESSDSYAQAWGDQSAMGVIAVAVFAEKQRPMPYSDYRARRYANQAAPAASAPAAPSSRQYKGQSKSQSADSVGSAAGTGYGEEEHSSSVRVKFRAEPYALEKHFYKYEWRETLCRKQIISCSPTSPRQPPRNRFWSDDGYAPPPPRY